MLYNKFIKEGSDLQINVRASCVQAVRQLLDDTAGAEDIRRPSQRRRVAGAVWCGRQGLRVRCFADWQRRCKSVSMRFSTCSTAIPSNDSSNP